MYSYYYDLKSMIEFPDFHADSINTILREAKEVEANLAGFYQVLANPYNEAMLARPQVALAFNNKQLNLLYAAAQLMLAIPHLKTDENIALSLHYLIFSGKEHHYPPSLNRLGWCYSQGEGIPVDYQKAANCFVDAGDWGNCWNCAGWCYEQLGKYSDAMWCYRNKLAKDQDNEVAQRHLNDCKSKLNEKVSAAPTLFAPNSDRVVRDDSKESVSGICIAQSKS